MTLIPKISHLLKLPELLKEKQRVEKIGRNNKEQSKGDWPPFDIEDELPVDPDKISKYKIKKSAKEPRKSKSGDDNIGRNIDLKI